MCNICDKIVALYGNMELVHRRLTSRILAAQQFTGLLYTSLAVLGELERALIMREFSVLHATTTKSCLALP